MQNNLNQQRERLTIGESANYLGVSIDTLRRWDNKGIISAYRSPSGHRYFDKNDLSKLFGQKYTHIKGTEKGEDKKDKLTVIKTPADKNTLISEDKIIKSTPASEDVLQFPSQKPQINQEQITTTILNPPEKISTKPQDLSSQTQSAKPIGRTKKDISWTTLIIIGLTLFTVVDLILLIIYFTSAKPLTSPVP